MICNKIGKEIARIRKMNNISQQRLAEVSGYHVEALSNIERGITQPSIEKLIRYCVQWGVS